MESFDPDALNPGVRGWAVDDIWGRLRQTSWFQTLGVTYSASAARGQAFHRERYTLAFGHGHQPKAEPTTQAVTADASAPGVEIAPGRGHGFSVTLQAQHYF